jgi:hypothetical protein
MFLAPFMPSPQPQQLLQKWNKLRANNCLPPTTNPPPTTTTATMEDGGDAAEVGGCGMSRVALACLCRTAECDSLVWLGWWPFKTTPNMVHIIDKYYNISVLIVLHFAAL